MLCCRIFFAHITCIAGKSEQIHKVIHLAHQRFLQYQNFIKEKTKMFCKRYFPNVQNVGKF